MSIRLRLTLWYTGILAVTLVLFGMALYFFLSVYLENEDKSNLKIYTEKVYSRIQVGLSLSMTGWNLNIELDNFDTIQDNGTYLQVANFATGEIKRSGNLQRFHLQLPVFQERAEEMQPFYEKIKISGISFLVYNVPLQLKNGQVVGLLQAAVYIGENEQFLSTLKLVLLFSALLTVIVAASLGWFLARKALRPIDHVIQAANRIGKGVDLDKRIIYSGPNDEIGMLTDTINGMLSRIEAAYLELDEAYHAQRRFVSDASHELRTPLTTIRGNVDLLEKMWKSAALPDANSNDGEKMQISLEAMQDIAGEAERMSRLVNDLLSLARADAGYVMHKENVELRPLVEEVARRAQYLPKTAEWRIGDLSPLEGAEVFGNKDYLQQLLFIFIDNGFKYTAEGYVQLDAVCSGNQVGFKISDTGIGMEKDEIPLIFERFYRADRSRGKTVGTGLGLSIAKWIIDEHQGSVEVTTRKGIGTTFTVWLPARFPASV